MIKRRELPMQVLLFIVTLGIYGIYGIYWLYVTNKEMIEHLGTNESPGLWTVFNFIPIASFFAIGRQGGRLDRISEGRYPQLLIFLAWIVFAPIVWILAQIELNKLADAQNAADRGAAA